MNIYVIPNITNLFLRLINKTTLHGVLNIFIYLKNINETHPGIGDDFKKGFFEIKTTEKPFSGISTKKLQH